MDCRICIKRDEEGFEVELTDPEIAKRNEDGKSPWKDPMVEYEFDTWDQVKAFLDKVVEKALPPEEEYNKAFSQAAKEVMKKGMM